MSLFPCKLHRYISHGEFCHIKQFRSGATDRSDSIVGCCTGLNVPFGLQDPTAVVLISEKQNKVTPEQYMDREIAGLESNLNQNPRGKEQRITSILLP